MAAQGANPPSEEPRQGLAPGDEAPPAESSAAENLCPECGGSGDREGRECSHCGGTGRVIEAIGGG